MPIASLTGSESVDRLHRLLGCGQTGIGTIMKRSSLDLAAVLAATMRAQTAEANANIAGKLSKWAETDPMKRSLLIEQP